MYEFVCCHHISAVLFPPYFLLLKVKILTSAEMPAAVFLFNWFLRRSETSS